MRISPAKKTWLIISLIFILLLVAGWYFLRTPIVGTNGLTYILKPGATVRTLSHDLAQQAELKQPTLFKLLSRVTGKSRHLKAGEYFFPANSTPYQVLNLIVSGKVIHHRFVIVNGWNIYDVLNALNKNKYIKHTLTGLTLKQIAEKMHLKHSSPEGWLYPNTYFFTLNTTDISILNRAYASMRKHFKQAWEKRANGLPYRSGYQALIVASMLEKEAALKQERPVIAGVILNRLKIWMPLQIDSTVIYALEPHFNGNLTPKDLRIKNPYNTYANYGLPPTPIAMPSGNAIHAALHPISTKALYFVAKGDGGHVFSNTLKEQRAAIKKYLKNGKES